MRPGGRWGEYLQTIDGQQANRQKAGGAQGLFSGPGLACWRGGPGVFKGDTSWGFRRFWPVGRKRGRCCRCRVSRRCGTKTAGGRTPHRTPDSQRNRTPNTEHPTAHHTQRTRHPQTPDTEHPQTAHRTPHRTPHSAHCTLSDCTPHATRHPTPHATPDTQHRTEPAPNPHRTPSALAPLGGAPLTPLMS